MCVCVVFVGGGGGVFLLFCFYLFMGGGVCFVSLCVFRLFVCSCGGPEGAHERYIIHNNKKQTKKQAVHTHKRLQRVNNTNF